MVANRKPTGRASATGTGLAAGAAFCLIWTVLGAMLVAKLIDAEVMKESAIGYGTGAILLTASFLGALVSYHKIKRQRMIMCLATGGIYLVLLISATALLFGGQYEAVGITALLILGGSGCAGLLGLNEGAGRKPKVYQKVRI